MNKILPHVKCRKVKPIQQQWKRPSCALSKTCVMAQICTSRKRRSLRLARSYGVNTKPVAAAGNIPFVSPATLSPTYEEGGYAIFRSIPSLFCFGHHSHKGCAGYTCPLQAMGCVSRALPDLSCCQKALRPTPGAPLSAVSGHKRYNTLDFPAENRVPTEMLLAPYWMTQRKAVRAAFGSVPYVKSRFICRSAHPDIRLIPACGLVRQGRYAWFVSSFLFVLLILKLTQFDEIIHRHCAPSEILMATVNGTSTTRTRFEIVHRNRFDNFSALIALDCISNNCHMCLLSNYAAVHFISSGSSYRVTAFRYFFGSPSTISST